MSISHPKSLTGADYKLQVESSNVPAASIVSYSKNTEFALKLYDWVMSSKENYNVPIFGIEGTDWKYVDKDKSIIERINTNIDRHTDELCPILLLISDS